MLKVIGKIIGSNITQDGVIPGVKVVKADGTAENAYIGELLHEGDKIVSENPDIVIKVKYLALPNDSEYAGVFTVLTDNSVVAPAEVADSVLDGNVNDVADKETAAGDDTIESSSSPYISMDPDVGDVAIVGIDRSAVLDDTGLTTTRTLVADNTTLVDNVPPTITSEAVVVFDENSLDPVIQVQATDTMSEVRYEIAPGLDSDRFVINPVTGVLSFITPPDYENPQDIGQDNIYNVNVIARDAYGNESTQELSIYINNTNDNIPVTENVAIDAIEDGGVFTGQLVGSDADNNKIEFVLTSELSPEEGTVTLDPVTGEFSYNIGENFQYLAEGETTTVTFTYKAVEVDSEEGFQSVPDSTVTITITGTNDQPVVEDVNINNNIINVIDFEDFQDFDLQEAETIQSSQIVNYKDINWGDHVYLANITGDYGGYDNAVTSGENIVYNGWAISPTTLVFNETATFYSMQLTSAWDTEQSVKFIAYKDGEEVYQSDYIVINNTTPTLIELNWENIDTLVIENTGSHWAMDDFTYSIGDELLILETNGIETIYEGTLSVTDVDLTDSHTFQLVNDSVNVVTDSAAEVTDLEVIVNSEDGSFSISGNFDALAEGEKATITFDYTATDDSGAENAVSEAKTVTLKVIGTNDLPVVLPVEENLLESDLADSDGFNNFVFASQLSVSDVDTTDTHTFAQVGNTSLNITTQNSEILEAITNDDTAYLKTLLSEFVLLPEIAVIVNNSTDVQDFLEYIYNLDTVDEILATVNSLDGIAVNVTTDAVSVNIDDTSLLADAGLLNVTVNADGSYYVTSPLFDNLSVDENVVVSFDYMATDSAGGESTTESVTLNVTGTNDTPVVVAAEDSASLVEDDINVMNEDIAAYSATLNEAYTSDTWTIEHDGGKLQILMSSDEFDTFLKIYDADGNLIATNDDGGAGYNSALLLDNLEAGTYTVEAAGALDEFGTYEIDFLNGVTSITAPDNDSVAEVESEFGELSAEGHLTFEDVDVTDTHTISVDDTTSNYGTLTATEIEPGIVTWEYTVVNDLVEYLAEGETREEVFEVSIDDGNGGVATQEVTVTITGTNDAPTINAVHSEVTGTVTEDIYNAEFVSDTTDAPNQEDAWTFNHTGGDLTVSMNSESFDTYLLIYDAAGNLIAQNDDGGTSTADTNAQLVLSDLPAGTYTIIASGYMDEEASEEAGETIYQSGPYEIIFEPAVNLTSYPEAAVMTEDMTNLFTTGDVVFEDIDLSDTHTVSAASADDSNLGTLSAVIAEDASLGTGVVEWTYSVADSDVQYLAEGETKTETFTITVTDNNGESVEQDITVTITGTNDRPVVENSEEALPENLTKYWLIGATGEDVESDIGIDDVPDEVTATLEELNNFISPDGSVSITDLAVDNPTDGSAVKFNTTTQAGETVTFMWMFVDAEGYETSADYEYADYKDEEVEIIYQDFAFVVVDGVYIDLLAQTTDYGIYNNGTFSYTFDTAGEHEITFGVMNDDDKIVDSAIYVAHVNGGEITSTDTIGYSEVYDDLPQDLPTVYGGTLTVDDVDTADTHTFELVKDSVTLETESPATISDLDVKILENGEYYMSGDFNQLAVGETATVTFEYIATDDSGADNASSEPKTVTLTVYGTNDAPVITDDLMLVHEVVEDSIDESAGLEAIAYTSSISVENAEESWVITHNGGALQVLMSSDEFDTYLKLYDAEGNLIVENDDGGAGYNSALLLDNLEAGTYTVVAAGALDEFGSYQIDFLTDVVVEGTPTEATQVVSLYDQLTADGEVHFADIDVTDTHTLSVENATDNLGSFEAVITSEGTVEWSYSVINELVQYLGEDVTKEEIFTLSIDDGNGGVVTQDVIVAITGTNDAPTINTIYTDTTGDITEGVYTAVYTADNSATESNDEWVVEHQGGVLSVTMNSTEFDAYLLVYNEAGELIAQNDDGAVESNAKIVFTDLPAGIYTIVASGYWDEEASEAAGETVYQSGPYEIIFEPSETFVTVPENAVVVSEASSELFTTGEIVFTELDDGDTHEVFVLSSEDNLGTLEAVVSSEAEFGTGIVSWTYTVDNAAVDYLAEGETKTETFFVTVRDDKGEAVDQEVTVTITGTNDRPVVENVVENVSETDFVGSIDVVIDESTGQTITVNNITYASTVAESSNLLDVDTIDTHTFGIATYSSQLGLISDVALGVTFTEKNPGILELYAEAAADSDKFNSLKSEIIAILQNSTLLSAIIASSSTATELIEDIANATSLDQVESIINETPGFAIEANYVESSDGTSVTLESVSISAEATQAQYDILAEHNVVNIVVDESGAYTISTPLIDPLAGDEDVAITFAYNATDNSLTDTATSESATVTVNVSGDNDAPVVGVIDSDYGVIGMFDIDGGNVDLSSVVESSGLEKINSIVVGGRTELNVSAEDVLEVVGNDDHILIIESSDDMADAVHLDDSFDKENAYDNGDGTHTYQAEVEGTSEVVNVVIEDTIYVD